MPNTFLGAIETTKQSPGVQMGKEPIEIFQKLTLQVRCCEEYETKYGGYKVLEGVLFYIGEEKNTALR